MHASRFDVVILGGGLAGLALACALRETRLKIGLVEQQAPTRPSGWDARVYAVSPANATFLQEIGVWKHLPAERLASVQTMRITGDAGAHLVFSAYESGVSELAWIAESSLMACELWENVKRQANLTLFSPAQAKAVEIGDGHAHLLLSDGGSVTTRLVVGADGRDSWLRQAVGLPAIDFHYGDMGVVANFSCELPHRSIARQWFLGDSVLAWLPLAGDRISLVWSLPDEHARELLTLGAEEFCRRVAAAGGNELGRFTLLTPAAAFSLRLMQVPQTVAFRVALLGDAAHAIHPLSGHGINLGFQDARALAHLLATTPEWQDIGSQRLLRRYQRARREETLLMQGATHALQQLFRRAMPGLRQLRNAGMNLTNALPVIKNLLVRYASGHF
ncbi:UbiH/UbiF family hydroxylase [Accumulibacter sp.]|uniref:UbiH/UbiF family hydroxylase n=1 Tax=Accumulibacter sp. TaxID=2053492 RepID=UPI002BA435B6|nr:UbiH/UbiF family hydroxylase [Accumulibacter sp.]HND38310.1 UbiH/UbiF family hydroxylase [Accumulibacter sp.]HNE39981.1 UbiH/UbiF family hydroxylase [Accumulibacter sp.]